MNSKSYAIIGVGAIGGFYGAKLAAAGFDVHFLARSDASHIRDHGLVVESKDGNFSLPHVNVYADASAMPACDVVAVCFKTTSNGDLPEILPSLVKKDSVVLVMQNGLGEEEKVARIVPTCPVLGVLCFVCAYKADFGLIRHLDFGRVTIGQHTADHSPSGITACMRDIAADFTEAGISAETLPDLGTARWKKLVWNIPYSGLAVVLSSTTDALNTNGHVRLLARDIMNEVCDAAAACGHPIEQSFPDAMMRYTDSMPPYSPSMKLDFDARKPMEVDSIFGSPVRAARQAGAHVPLVNMLYRQLAFLDEKNTTHA